MAFPVGLEVEDTSGAKFFVLSTQFRDRPTVQEFHKRLLLQSLGDNVAGLRDDHQPVFVFNLSRRSAWMQEVFDQLRHEITRYNGTGTPTMRRDLLA